MYLLSHLAVLPCSGCDAKKTFKDAPFSRVIACRSKCVLCHMIKTTGRGIAHAQTISTFDLCDILPVPNGNLWTTQKETNSKETDVQPQQTTIMWRSRFDMLVTHANRVFRKFGKRPLFYSTMISGSYMLYDYASWHLSMWWQQNKVITTMRKGCLPDPPNPSYICERNELVQALYDKVLHPHETSMFRVVVGPLGCGKTWCITTAIRKRKQVSVVTCVITICNIDCMNGWMWIGNNWTE